MEPGTSATTHRSVAIRGRFARRAACRAAIGILAAATVLAALGAVVALRQAPAAAGTGEEPATSGVPAGVPAEEAVPDVVISIEPGSALAEESSGLRRDLAAVRGVSWVADDRAAAGPRLLVGFDAPAGDAPLEAVESVVAGQEEAADLAVAGRAVVDRELQARIGRGTLAGVVLAMVAAGGVVTLLAGWVRGGLAAVTVALSGWLGTTLGSMAAGAFDGSVVTTSVPGALAAIVVSGCLVVRLLSWFESPEGDDQGEMIRRAVSSLAAELILFFAGFVVLAVFLEWLGPARSAATVALVGAITAALLTLAIVPLSLAGLDSLDPPFGPSRPEVDGQQLLPFNAPNGQDFPLLALAVFGFLLACLSLFAFQASSRSQILDERSLGDQAAAEPLAAQLASEGDPTNSVLAVFPPSTGAGDRMAWLQRVSQLTSVAHIDTPAGRFELGELVADDPAADGEDASAASEEAAASEPEVPAYATVVPRVTGRSEAAQELVGAIRATNAPVNAELSGVPVDAVLANQRDSQTVWATILSLAAVGSVVIFTLVGDVVLAALTAGLRLLGSTAVVGVYHLLVTDVSGSELQVAVITLAMGIGLFELGFLRRLLLSHRVENTDLLLDRALGSEGRAAAIGLGLVAAASIGIAFTSLGVVQRLAIVMLVGVVLEVVVGAWLLRPALLGTRAIGHFAAQPVQTALRALAGGDGTEIDHQSWVGIVDYLLHAEFNFLVEAGAADLDAVYLPGTALHRQAAEHQESLAGAGLRIVGRSPQLRSVRVVSATDPVTVAVTVDHPIRQLVGPSGKIVGVRKPERRSVMLWLAARPDGSYRIADSVELGAVPLAVGHEPVAEVANPPALGVSLE